MPRYDDTFVDRFLEPWNRHDVDGALALMTDDCVWEIPRGREPDDAMTTHLWIAFWSRGTNTMSTAHWR